MKNNLKNIITEALGILGIALLTISAIKSVPPVDPSNLRIRPWPNPKTKAPVIAANKTSSVTVIWESGDVNFTLNERSNIPAKVFKAFNFPRILIENIISGTPIISITVETVSPLILLRTTDNPLSPPGAIVLGLKNMLIPKLISIHPKIIPKASIMISFKLFVIFYQPPMDIL